MKTILKGGNLIDESGGISTDTDILIDGGKISKIGKNLKCDGSEIIDCGKKYITPGFANMHAHSPMNIFKGIAEDVNIDDWFNKLIWPYESKINDDDIYSGTQLARAEMINNGITVFADHYFKSDIIAKACKDMGIRADIAYTIFGFDQSCDKELDEAVDFFEKYKNDELIAPRLGPHSPYICSADTLKKITEKAKELGCGIHIHISEESRQVEESKKNHRGKTPFEFCYDNGCFDVPCILAHGLWIEKSDLKYINKDTLLVTCPKTYCKLGMGKGNIWDFFDKVHIAVGTDGAASSNTIDVLEQARIFALLGKINDKAESFDLKSIWKMLFSGHRFLKFNSGRLSEGCAADLNIFDLDNLNTAPVYNPLAAIIYSAVPRINITDVMIDGKFLKRNGELIFDMNDILSRSNLCAKEVYARGKGQAEIFF